MGVAPRVCPISIEQALYRFRARSTSNLGSGSVKRASWVNQEDANAAGTQFRTQ